jgi:uncharacterized protein YggU (UPF0235/DUF167 family)
VVNAQGALATSTRTGARLRVRLTPKANADRIEGVGEDAGGASHLKVRVRAAPESGAANAALEALIAKRIGAPRSRVRVAKGATSRTKMVDIDGVDAPSLMRRIEEIVEKP